MMKTLMFFILFGVGLTLSFEAKSQAVVIFDKTISFYDRDGNEFPSVSAHTTLTPSGNILKTATFQLPEDHPLVPESGKKYLPSRITAVDIYGNEYKLINYNIKVGKNGKFTVVMHLNGSGQVFPNGW